MQPNNAHDDTDGGSDNEADSIATPTDHFVCLNCQTPVPLQDADSHSELCARQKLRSAAPRLRTAAVPVANGREHLRQLEPQEECTVM
jgi:hypothetical protein